MGMLNDARIAQQVEIERAEAHLDRFRFNRQSTIAVLVGWMGIDRAKEMNNFWDESKRSR